MATLIEKSHRLEEKIHLIRGHRVILDSTLAALYGVTTTRFNEQVKRNLDRFPEDFMFRLTFQEFNNLISQIATSRQEHGGRRKLPLVFTEHGVIMAANILNSLTAVRMSIHVVRAFVRMRELSVPHKDLAKKIDALEQKYDSQFKVVFQAIRELMEPPPTSKRKIGFQSR